MNPAFQMQIKNNASDLQEYLKDLKSWETEVKEKDAALSSHKSILKEKLPPVRGSSRMKEAKKKKTKPQKPKAQKQSRISSYDFKAWDKFNVEEACEAVDYDVRSTSSSSEEEPDEDQQELVKKQQAVYEKDRGNRLFKEGEFELSVECYTQAADLDPLNAVMPANRAMALLKLERYAAAEKDCSVALSLDDTYVKAYLRRGTARLKLGKTEEAREDFTAALRLEPGNKVAKSELDKLNKERDKKFVRPVSRSPRMRSKEPLVRIDIEDIGEDTPAPAPPPITTTTTHQTSDHPVNENNEISVQNTVKTPIIEVIDSNHSSKAPPVHIDAKASPVQSSDNAVNESSQETRPATKMSVLSTQPELIKDSASPGCADSTLKGVGVVTLPPVPENSISLQADWKRVRRDKTILGEYFKSLPVSKYPALLQQSLETNVFSDIIDILLNDYVGVGVSCLTELQSLTRVKRFSVALMFLPPSDQAKLKEIFHKLKELIKEPIEIDLLKELLTKYGV